MGTLLIDLLLTAIVFSVLTISFTKKQLITPNYLLHRWVQVIVVNSLLLLWGVCLAIPSFT